MYMVFGCVYEIHGVRSGNQEGGEKKLAVLVLKFSGVLRKIKCRMYCTSYTVRNGQIHNISR